MSLEYILNELPMAQGWALLAWCNEGNPQKRRAKPGYIGQEAETNG